MGEMTKAVAKIWDDTGPRPDIVERLRASLSYDTPARYPDLVTEAANEIERLRKMIATHDVYARLDRLEAAVLELNPGLNWCFVKGG